MKTWLELANSSQISYNSQFILLYLDRFKGPSIRPPNTLNIPQYLLSNNLIACGFLMKSFNFDKG